VISVTLLSWFKLVLQWQRVSVTGVVSFHSKFPGDGSKMMRPVDDLPQQVSVLWVPFSTLIYCWLGYANGIWSVKTSGFSPFLGPSPNYCNFCVELDVKTQLSQPSATAEKRLIEQKMKVVAVVVV